VTLSAFDSSCFPRGKRHPQYVCVCVCLCMLPKPQVLVKVLVSVCVCLATLLEGTKEEKKNAWIHVHPQEGREERARKRTGHPFLPTSRHTTIFSPNMVACMHRPINPTNPHSIAALQPLPEPIDQIPSLRLSLSLCPTDEMTLPPLPHLPR